MVAVGATLSAPNSGATVARRATERPGDVISATAYTPRLVAGVPMSARAWRITYVSRTATGDPTRVTGSVIVPDEPWNGEGARPLLGFAVGTQGLADRCAASRQLRLGTEYEAPVIAQAIQRGWAVAVTDYPGLGTPGDHTYVVHQANGRAVLDSMRAARRLPAADIAAHGPAAIYGFSEGGGAAGGAIELQPTYAPDIPLKGAFVGAAPSDFRAVLDHVDGTPLVFLAGYAAVGFEQAYPGIGFDRYLTPLGRRMLDKVRDTCIVDAIALGPTQPHDLDAYFTADPFSIPSIRRRLAQNSLGHTAPQTAVLVGGGTNDEVIPHAVVKKLYRDYCRLGVNAHFRAVPLTEHLSGGALISPAAMRFLAARFAGERLPRAADC
ncbi:lipase [Nocardioides humilatus]|uniref:Lipase n=2 Tax=Nocardioides humilatus TaxID=2607660 RepID=A0A5B1LHY6_9ACTN|nr:lipase [Nocardioides humilatus]